MSILYVLHAKHLPQVKIGISETAETMSSRFSTLGGHAKICLNKSLFYGVRDARRLEQFLHYHFDSYSIKPPLPTFIVGAGHTECFHIDVLQPLQTFIRTNSLAELLDQKEIFKNSEQSQRLITNRILRYDAHIHACGQELRNRENEAFNTENARKVTTLIERLRPSAVGLYIRENGRVGLRCRNEADGFDLSWISEFGLPQYFTLGGSGNFIESWFNDETRSMGASFNFGISHDRSSCPLNQLSKTNSHVAVAVESMLSFAFMDSFSASKHLEADELGHKQLWKDIAASFIPAIC